MRPAPVSGSTSGPGASTAPELDGALAEADGIELRLPYQSDPVSRQKINSGHMEYIDVHLSHVAQMVWEGFLGHLDVALIEVSRITADGALIPSSSVGNNKTWIDQADAVILEVNSWQSADLDGMHDIYYGTALPPDRRPIPLVRPGDRIGEPYLRCPPEKVIAVVETAAPTETPGSPRPTRRRDGSTAISSNSSSTRSLVDGCRQSCSRSSRGWATWPTRSSPSWRSRDSRTSRPTPR
jgi:acyl-CoA hydrolase